eukprot:Filipodium_phascolosomae@DN2776_c1_g1_i46.p1
MGQVRVIKGSAVQAARGGDAEWAIVKPASLTQNVVTKVAAHFSLTTPIKSASNPLVKSLYIELPSEVEFADSTKACTDSEYGLQVSKCDATTCTVMTVAGDTSKAWKCVADSANNGLKLIAKDIAADVSDIKVEFKVKGVSLGTAKKAIFVSFSDESPAKKSHTQYKAAANAVDFGESRADLKVVVDGAPPPFELKSGFPVKAGVTAPTTAGGALIKLALLITTAASTDSNLVLQLPTNYGLANNSDCKQTITTPPTGYQLLVIGKCTATGNTATLKVSGTPSHTAEPYIFALKVTTPPVPPATGNEFIARYHTQASHALSAVVSTQSTWGLFIKHDNFHQTGNESNRLPPSVSVFFFTAPSWTVRNRSPRSVFNSIYSGRRVRWGGCQILSDPKRSRSEAA